MGERTSSRLSPPTVAAATEGAAASRIVPAASGRSPPASQWSIQTRSDSSTLGRSLSEAPLPNVERWKHLWDLEIAKTLEVIGALGGLPADVHLALPRHRLHRASASEAHGGATTPRFPTSKDVLPLLQPPSAYALGRPLPEPDTDPHLHDSARLVAHREDVNALADVPMWVDNSRWWKRQVPPDGREETPPCIPIRDSALQDATAVRPNSSPRPSPPVSAQ